MALVKKSKIGANPSTPAVPAAKPAAGSAARGKLATVAERVAAATEELASGITQSAAAAEELRRSMEQIASGAEEAAAASQEQLAATKRIIVNLGLARGKADDTRRRTEAVQIGLAETSTLVSASVRAIERNAQRQANSVVVIAELERRAAEIGGITQVVAGISDQTNLLALNAAIEAARAGDQGRGFAVVAEEVRALAESSEKSAKAIQDHADAIQTDVRGVSVAVKDAADTAISEARGGLELAATLDQRRADMSAIAQGAQEILETAADAERAAMEAQRGAEIVASAAEQQSAAAVQAQSAIQEQTQALDQSAVASQSLAKLSEKLRAGKGDSDAAGEIASGAEQLSASIQEMSGASGQIMAAITQINKGAQQQAAATQQTSAALAQIEKSAGLAKDNAGGAVKRVGDIAAALGAARGSATKLITGVGDVLKTSRASVDRIVRLERIGREIEKIVDNIALVAVQTTMLAVSGAVEAARAGDAGRGFAVVSNDIRNLARETATNLERIKDTVRGILEQIAVLRQDLEQVIASNEAEVQNNENATLALQRLEDDVSALNAANRDILEGAGAIAAAVTETALGARQIAAAAEEASAAARQAATASSQQARGAEDLAASIEEIASLAQEL